jgi:ABC-type nitrate/sulfonate/bicarbonate transport system substrate-binding protein
LSETPSPSDLDRLVVSSGDFGLAYLTERWAARISADLARLCVSAGDAFPEAFAMLRAWLQPQEHPEYLVHTFAIARLARKHPEQALDFLDLVMGELNQWPPSDLGNCLQQIRDAAPALEADERFQRLSAYLRQHGQEF